MPATRRGKSPTVPKPGRPVKVKRGPKPKVKAPPSEEDEESVQDILEGRDDVKENGEEEEDEDEDITLTAEEAKERVSSFRAMGTGRPFSTHDISTLDETRFSKRNHKDGKRE